MSSFFTTSKEIKALAIGCFDGLHLGHFKLIENLPKKNSALLIIDKFKGLKLCTDDDKKALCGLEIIKLEFEKIKNLSASEFLDELKKSFENLELIVVGYDFVFGKERCANAEDIERLSKIKTIIVPEFKLDNLSVHTSLIKDFLSKGELEKANFLLGREYFVKGALIKGQGLGKNELVPTLNLDIKDYFLPQNGVYASFCELKNQSYKSVSFVGVRNSDEKFSVETHILGEFKENLNYGEMIKLTFVKFLRLNAKFKDFASLKKQILLDIKEAKKALKDKNER